jgi:hypothetical protein
VAAFGCEQVPAGQSIWVRLTQQVSTYNAKPGDPVHAVLTDQLVCDYEIVAPLGANVEGSVVSVRKVGFGVRHETASLRITFNRIQNSGNVLRVETVLASVENAREQVSQGTIHGIRSTYTPQGRITSKLHELPKFTLGGLNPYQDIGLLVFKATFPIFPEPEIYLPAGTDMQLKLAKPIEEPPAVAAENTTDAPVDEATVTTLVGSLPQRSTTLEMADADLVNLVFLGSREQLQAAFNNAGWQTSNAFNKKTFAHTFYAFLNNSAYAHNPMRPFLLQGQPAAMNWQKSLNSYAKRDHLRVWQWPEPVGDQTAWVSSSTHDVSASLSLKYREFVHHISPDIDDERSKVVRDLNAAGCVQSVRMVPRHGVANLTQNYVGDMVRTDGAVAVVQLQDCHPTVPELASAPTSAPYKPGNIWFRYIRRQVLTFRSDIWRANIIYAGYDLGRMAVHAWKHRAEMPPVAAVAGSPRTPDAAADSRGTTGGTSSID